MRRFKFFDATPIILLRPNPKQRGIVADAVQISGWLSLLAKGGNGFPHGHHYFLKQIFSVVAVCEPVHDPMQDCAVIAHPFGESFLLFVNIHWFLDIYETADADFLQTKRIRLKTQRRGFRR